MTKPNVRILQFGEAITLTNGKFCHLLIICVNSLDPDQAQILGLIWNQTVKTLMIFLKDFFWKS